MFSGYTDSKPIGEISLSDFLLRPLYKEKVEEIRREKDKARRRELKAKLPAVTPSGIFSKRSNAGLIRHSGFICIDIDGDQNPDINDWEALKSNISDFQGLWCAGLSVSGNGVFLIIKIKYPEKHLRHFHAIDGDLQTRGIAVDAACKDVARLRGASYDANPFYNPDAGFYESLKSFSSQPEPKTTISLKAPVSAESRNLTAARVVRLVEVIEQMKANIADFYPDWYAVGCSLASEFGESGRGLFHIISRQSDKYDYDQCNAQYSRCLGTCSNTSISTLFWYCKQHGIIVNKQKSF